MCITLAVESSTAEPSIALLRGGLVIAERRWTSSRGDASRLLSEIRAMTQEHAICLDSVSLYAVGLGPGGFTGLRISVAAVQALAMPSRTPVIGICSADAAAAAIRREHPGDTPVLIVGDARRDRLWAIPYPRAGQETNRPEPHVIPFADAAPLLNIPGLTIATADWPRIGNILEQTDLSSATLIRMNRFPNAADVGRLALPRWEAGNAPSRIDPIYVHPPVFIEPVFTNTPHGVNG